MVVSEFTRHMIHEALTHAGFVMIETTLEEDGDYDVDVLPDGYYAGYNRDVVELGVRVYDAIWKQNPRVDFDYIDLPVWIAPCSCGQPYPCYQA